MAGHGAGHDGRLGWQGTCGRPARGRRDGASPDRPGHPAAGEGPGPGARIPGPNTGSVERHGHATGPKNLRFVIAGLSVAPDSVWVCAVR